MHLLKQAINYLSPRFLGKIPAVQAKTPQSRLVLAVWARVEATLKKEAPIKARDDRNFTTLLETVKRALIFLCEEDRYYKRWLGLTFLLFAEETGRALQQFSYEDALASSPRPLGLTREQYEQSKRALFENSLAGYLMALERAPESIAGAIAEAYDHSGRVQIPAPAKRMAYSLLFEREDREHAGA